MRRFEKEQYSHKEACDSPFYSSQMSSTVPLQYRCTNRTRTTPSPVKGHTYFVDFVAVFGGNLSSSHVRTTRCDDVSDTSCLYSLPFPKCPGVFKAVTKRPNTSPTRFATPTKSVPQDLGENFKRKGLLPRSVSSVGRIMGHTYPTAFPGESG